MSRIFLVFTDTQGCYLQPAIIQSHPGLREELSYLDFKKTKIVAVDDLGDFNKHIGLKDIVIQVMIIDPDKDYRLSPQQGRFKTLSKCTHTETISSMKGVYRDIHSQYWIKTFFPSEQRRIRVASLEMTPLMQKLFTRLNHWGPVNG